MFLRAAGPPGRQYKNLVDVPAHIEAAAQEAYTCLSVEAYRGAAQIARAVVEATAKEKWITQGNLQDKIEGLFKANLIREHIREAADEIRHLGNEMAHGDFIAAVPKGDAELIVALMAEILDEVFMSPARVARARAARAARVSAKAAGTNSLAGS